MRKRIIGFIFAFLVFLALGLVNATPASAAPIDCPGSQVATKTATGWDCVNKPGNETGAEDPKNPNAGKDKF